MLKTVQIGSNLALELTERMVAHMANLIWALLGWSHARAATGSVVWQVFSSKLENEFD